MRSSKRFPRQNALDGSLRLLWIRDFGDFWYFYNSLQLLEQKQILVQKHRGYIPINGQRTSRSYIVFPETHCCSQLLTAPELNFIHWNSLYALNSDGRRGKYLCSACASTPTSSVHGLITVHIFCWPVQRFVCSSSLMRYFSWWYKTVWLAKFHTWALS